MAARARLDLTAQQRPAVARAFRRVERMSSSSSWGGVVRDSIDLINSAGVPESLVRLGDSNVTDTFAHSSQRLSSFKLVFFEASQRARTEAILRSRVLGLSGIFAGCSARVGGTHLQRRMNQTDSTSPALSNEGTARRDQSRLSAAQDPLRGERRDDLSARKQDLATGRILPRGTSILPKIAHSTDHVLPQRYRAHAHALGPVSIDTEGPRSRVSRLAELFENCTDAGLFAIYSLRCARGWDELINISVPDLQFLRAAARTLVFEVSCVSPSP